MFTAAPAFKTHPSIRHGFFGRQGGVSKAHYASLNIDMRKDDHPADVAENRARVAAALGGAGLPLVTLDQVHGVDCPIVQSVADFDGWTKADALATKQAGVILGILTADCAPVLFAGHTAAGEPVIGAAHAGWRGAVAGVMESTVAAMVKLGAEQGRINASVGPCIGVNEASYEVSADFLAAFADQAYFTPLDAAGQFAFRFQDYICDRLAGMGIGAVTRVTQDTYDDAAHFFSFRRNVVTGTPDGGRQVSAIVILP